jgi:superfamily II DNA or RNA helicase
MRELRDYQNEGIETVFRQLKAGTKRQLFVLATGLGKTFTAVKLIEQMNVRTLWLTHTEDLIEQSALSIVETLLDKEHVDHIEDSDGIIEFMKSSKNNIFSTRHEREILNRIGLIKRELFQINAPIVVASVQTIHRRLEKIPKDHFGLIIVDEAHLSAANTWTKTIEWFDFELLLGLTATPYRADGVSLSNLFDKITFERDIAWGIKNKYLCELDAYRVKTGTDISTVSTQAGDFNQKELGREIDTPVRNNLIVDKYIEYASGRPFIVFGLNIEHAKNLAAAFNDKSIATTFVVSDENECPNRRERIEAFKSGEYVGLSNVNILTAGFDYPDIQCVIMARPTKSLTMYLQCIGRGTRLKSNGNNCIILDIVDVSGKHSLVNTWTLEGSKPLEERIFLSEERKDALIEKREANKRRLEAEIKKDAKVDLMRLPDVVIYDSASNREAATEAQLNYLKSKGYDIVEASWTKGQCSEILSSLPASYTQINQLKEWGFDVSGAPTVGQFKKAEAMINSQSKYKKLIVDNKVKLPFKGLK